MASSSNSNWAETTLIACAAAALSSYVLFQLQKKTDDRRYPWEATFLQNGRTLSGSEKTVALQARGWSMEEALEKNKEESAKAK